MPLALRRRYTVILCAAALLAWCASPSMPGERVLFPNNPGGTAQGPVQTLERKTLQVKWERTGGFAGMRMAATIDSESLSEEEARRLSELVDAADFFELPEEIGTLAGGADRFLYTLTVEMEGRRHTVHTGEAAAPPGLRALIRWLSIAARKGRQGGGPQ